MAQPIANTVKSPNTLQGLLGLLPTPKSTVANSTPATIPSQLAPKTTATPFNGGATTNGSFMGTPAPASTGLMPAAPVATQTSTAGLYPPGTPQNGGNITQANTLPNLPVTPPTPTQTFTTPNGAVVNADGTIVSPSPTTPGLFSSVASSLAGSGAANTALGANAQKIASDAGTAIANTGAQGARFEAGQRTTGTTPVAEGNAAVTAQTTAAEQAAIAAGANVALQGNQQAISAQGQTQSALATAGGLAQPSTAAFGQTVFDPTTGTYVGASTGGLPADVMQQYAQMAVTGQYSAIPSFITSNPVLNAQLNVAAKALNPSFTPVGATGTSGVLAGIPALQSANAAADGIKNTINTYLQQNPQLNPSDLAAGNLLNQWIQGKQLTDPKYQTLFNYLDEYTNTLAPILGVGGDPTNLKTQIAQGFVNGAASGQSITQVLNAISGLATNKIADLQSGANGGGTTVPPAGTTATTGYAETW